MMITVEHKSHAMVKQGSPLGELKLTFHEAGKPVIGRPAIEKKTVHSHALTEGFQVAGWLAGFSKSIIDGMKLMTAITAVLLSLPAHSVNNVLLRGMVKGVNAGVEQPL